MALSGPLHVRARRCVRCGADGWLFSSKHWRCGPCTRRNGRLRLRRRRDSQPARELHSKAKQRARASGVVFTVTLADVVACWPSDNRCPALGVPLVRGRGVLHAASPTLDRIDNSAGYTPGNIAVISHAANRAKGGLTREQVARLADWMAAVGAP